MRRIAYCTLALCTIVTGCTDSSRGEVEPPLDSSNNLTFEARDLGGGAIEIVLTGKNLGHLAVSGIACEIVFSGGSVVYNDTRTTVGPFFSDGQVGAGFRETDPATLVVGAAIPPTAAPQTDNEALTIFSLGIDVPELSGGDQVDLACVIKAFSLFQRDPGGGFKVQIDSTNFTYNDSFSLTVQG